MDHHISCVARVLQHLADNPRVPQRPRDVCSICIDLGDLAGAIIDEGFIDAIWHSPEDGTSVGLESVKHKGQLLVRLAPLLYVKANGPALAGPPQRGAISWCTVALSSRRQRLLHFDQTYGGPCGRRFCL